MSEEPKHLTFGGSSAHRWLNCAGSAQLIGTLPPQAPNPHMERGTRAHALLELALKEARTDVTEFDGMTLGYGGDEYDEEDVNAVQVALDYVNEIKSRHTDSVLFVEAKVVLSADVGGTADVMLYLPSTQTLHVIDYKHGTKFVDAEGNAQLKLYAAAALMSFTEGPVNYVHATIIQPRSWQGEAVRTAIYGPADLIAYSDDVDAAVAAARVPSAPTKSGEWCTWCPAEHVCPARAHAATSAINSMVAGEEQNITLTFPAADALRSADGLAQALAAVDAFEEWGDAVRAAAYAKAVAGEAIAGYKLVETQSRVKWLDAAAALAWAEANTMLEVDAIAPRKLITPTQMLAKLKADKKLAADMAAHTERPAGKLKLVVETAKGEPVNPLQLTATSFAGAVTIER